MKKRESRFFNRELSWLEFNQRVLDEAMDASVPVLERLKFLAISSSNLDEFFMVRVGGLYLMLNEKIATPDPTGLTPAMQMEAVAERVREMVNAQYDVFAQEIEPALSSAGIEKVLSLDRALVSFIRRFFENEIFPLLSTVSVDGPDRFPMLANLKSCLLVRLAPAEGAREPRYALVPIPDSLDRVIPVPSEEGYRYILLEDILKMSVEMLFPGETVRESSLFRITRNADLSVHDEFAADLLEKMEEVLQARKESSCVRLEVEAEISRTSLRFLQKTLSVSSAETFENRGPLDFSGLIPLAFIEGFDSLRYPEWQPRPCPDVDPNTGMFDILGQKNVLLCHPFESFDPVLRLLNEAADDPNVLAIKQTLYRTSRNSPVVAALRRAVDKGKSVTAVVELKARFDEARNIEWARDLEKSGVLVIYGVKGYKTHAKITIVIRRETSGITRYMHFGTGNYNESTARFYTDVSFMTADEDLGADATSFFNAVTGYSQPVDYRRISAAPITLRDTLLRLIADEAERKQHGQKALIMAKMNSLVCPRLIEALYEASGAGVKIMLNVRGICCLRPGIKGVSENIVVSSIVDRFLEHSRVFYFRHGGEDLTYISSADWMPRNLDRRIELLIPVHDSGAKEKLKYLLETCFADNVKARHLDSVGAYRKATRASGARKVRAQEVLCARAGENLANASSKRRTVFEPHKSPDADT